MPLPDVDLSAQILRLHLEDDAIPPALLTLVAQIMSGSSGSALRDLAHQTRRTVLLSDEQADVALLKNVARRAKSASDRRRFVQLASQLLPERYRSIGQLATLTGLSKSTVHGYLHSPESADA
jgi:hypothetical protein